jgi:16S rRNA (cytidine1402-2'-O)-methyltransferase
VGILYVVGVPQGDLKDITLRALRILKEVALVVADDVGHAQRLLAPYNITTPLVAANSADASPDQLEKEDVALLVVGAPLVPQGSSYQLVRDVIEQGFPVAAVPGPDSLTAALVISGLPADSFVHLGELPQQPAARRHMLASIAGEQRTLVIQSSARHLPDRLSELDSALGDRPLVIAAESERGIGATWRGTLGEASEQPPEPLGQDRCTLVIGGAHEQALHWDEEQLRSEIQACLDQGLGVKETSQKLAPESGWPRREIYRLAVKLGQFPPEITTTE